LLLRVDLLLETLARKETTEYRHLETCDESCNLT